MQTTSTSGPAALASTIAERPRNEPISTIWPPSGTTAAETKSVLAWASVNQPSASRAAAPRLVLVGAPDGLVRHAAGGVRSGRLRKPRAALRDNGVVRRPGTSGVGDICTRRGRQRRAAVLGVPALSCIALRAPIARATCAWCAREACSVARRAALRKRVAHGA